MDAKGCLSSSCRYATDRTGQHVNGPCRCDECGPCGARIRPGYPGKHHEWCPQTDWVPEHHRKTEKE